MRAPVSGCSNSCPLSSTRLSWSGLSTNLFFSSGESKISVCFMRLEPLRRVVFSVRMVSTTHFRSSPTRPRLLNTKAWRLSASFENFSWSLARVAGSFVYKRCSAECDLLHCLHRTDVLVNLGDSLYGGTDYMGACYTSPCLRTIAELVRPSIYSWRRVNNRMMASRPPE